MDSWKSVAPWLLALGLIGATLAFGPQFELESKLAPHGLFDGNPVLDQADARTRLAALGGDVELYRNFLRWDIGFGLGNALLAGLLLRGLFRAHRFPAWTITAIGIWACIAWSSDLLEGLAIGALLDGDFGDAEVARLGAVTRTKLALFFGGFALVPVLGVAWLVRRPRPKSDS
ncbi:MAG: hypothetical protein ACYS26_14180 [Planctomycetota bacterium]|jgi:hypothetical protein